MSDQSDTPVEEIKDTRYVVPQDMDDIAERPLEVEGIEEDEDEISERPDAESNGKGEPEKDFAAIANEEEERLKEIEKAREDLEKLAPETGAVRWVIGKPPEHGGKDRQFAIYVQEKLPWMPRQKFFSLVTRTMALAVREGGGSLGSMSEIFNDEEGGTFLDRGRRWTERDFGDLGSFVTTLLELIGHSEQFMLEAYCIWLNVPKRDKEWAQDKFNQPWKPEEGKWGLTEEDHEKLINNFIDQNYEDIRRFFTETLPSIFKRMALHEKSRARQEILPV